MTEFDWFTLFSFVSLFVVTWMAGFLFGIDHQNRKQKRLHASMFTAREKE